MTQTKNLEEMTGLKPIELYTLLVKSSWELVDAYGITGREHYLREAKHLREVIENLSRFVSISTASSQ
jgi:hypothetical protein